MDALEVGVALLELLDRLLVGLGDCLAALLGLLFLLVNPLSMLLYKTEHAKQDFLETIELPFHLAVLVN